jgi:hypothetical protein
VLLRMPGAAIPGDVGEQLGLEPPTFQDVTLEPVVFRKATAKETDREMLVSAAAVTSVVGTLAYDSAKVLFADAVGVVVDGDLYEIEWVRESEAFGVVYLYRLGLRGSLSLTV